MASNCSSADVWAFLATAFEWIKEKCIWIWSFVVVVVKFLTSTRFLLRVITTLFVLSGASLLAVGIAGFVLLRNYFQFIGDTYYLLPGFAIVTSIVIFLTAILGFCAVKREKYEFVVAYSTLLAVILIVEIIITAVSFVIVDSSLSYMNDGFELQTMRASMQDFIQYGRNADIWSTMQQELQCCGVQGKEDYGSRLPISCCYNPLTAFSPFECTANTGQVIYNGCSTMLRYMCADYVFAVAVTAASASGLQVIITVIAVFIAHRIKSQHRGISYRGLLQSQMDQGSKPACYNTIPGVNVSEPDLHA